MWTDDIKNKVRKAVFFVFNVYFIVNLFFNRLQKLQTQTSSKKIGS